MRHLLCRRHRAHNTEHQQAERMEAEFDSACGKICLRLNLTKMMFMKNELVPDAPFTLNGTNFSESSSYVYLGREVNMMNDLAPELCGRKRAAWGAFKNIEEVVKKTKNIRLRAHLFDTGCFHSPPADRRAGGGSARGEEGGRQWAWTVCPSVCLPAPP
ncbi:hypothetical protein V3C99_002679 [Haemonchus contortus]